MGNFVRKIVADSVVERARGPLRSVAGAILDPKAAPIDRAGQDETTANIDFDTPCAPGGPEVPHDCQSSTAIAPDDPQNPPSSNPHNAITAVTASTQEQAESLGPYGDGGGGPSNNKVTVTGGDNGESRTSAITESNDVNAASANPQAIFREPHSPSRSAHRSGQTSSQAHNLEQEWADQTGTGQTASDRIEARAQSEVLYSGHAKAEPAEAVAAAATDGASVGPSGTTVSDTTVIENESLIRSTDPAAQLKTRSTGAELLDLPIMAGDPYVANRSDSTSNQADDRNDAGAMRAPDVYIGRIDIVVEATPEQATTSRAPTRSGGRALHASSAYLRQL